MCRFLIYKGNERFLADWLIRPSNSLIRQSYQATEMPEPLNGDGFGVGWYSPGDDPTPCLFTSLTPAWSNRNLRRLAVRVRSSCCFAHVRAATRGSLVSEQNCHPFRFGRFLWMHNGRIAGFLRIMRVLRRTLRDDLYRHLKGTTDSEHAFHLFLEQLTPERDAVRRSIETDLDAVGRYKARFLDLHHELEERDLEETSLLDRMVEHLGRFPPKVLERAMLATLSALGRWTREAGVKQPSFYNFAATDGETILVTRYVDRDDAEPPSLYYSVDFTSPNEGGEHTPAILICSEPLTDVHEGWHPVPRNHLLSIGPEWTAELLPIDSYSDSSAPLAE